ncbi:uncharacterized protein LOC124707908 [Lolium rigidum]|uniref:uncharacterized protein LOC124707908 n=1 Tax=Lolium rigidum TaxID=89674 RepID=UPI001F5DEA09|nr:uncharacterized protein LOC124707908 [Lolium rigidum]
MNLLKTAHLEISLRLDQEVFEKQKRPNQDGHGRARILGIKNACAVQWERKICSRGAAHKPARESSHSSKVKRKMVDDSSDKSSEQDICDLMYRMASLGTLCTLRLQVPVV